MKRFTTIPSGHKFVNAALTSKETLVRATTQCYGTHWSTRALRAICGAEKSFNSAGSFVELRTKVTNYAENRLHRKKVIDDNSPLAMISERSKPKHKSSSEKISPSKLSNTNKTCLCSGMRGHTRDQFYKRDQVEYTYCNMKGHLVQTCKKKTRESQAESLALRFRSAN